MSKTFKAALNNEDPREIPYRASFRHFGELFVIHKRIKSVLVRGATVPTKELECSHYKTGTKIPMGDGIHDVPSCEEEAKRILDQAGKEKCLEGIKKYPVINAMEPELGSLFEEDE